ncbi:type II toxin-antitoxin system CcdA family antitoxin [Pseudomonas mosselii]|uniref:type II toxin-antitoxin system CcdA family antitoxin n=1 Tax=Pseudomonas mosselii TaxID=78327 RepID=UPI0009F5E8A8
MKPKGVSPSLPPSIIEAQTAPESDPPTLNVEGALPVGPVNAIAGAHWAEENRAAIKAYNLRVETAGVFSNALRYF